MQIYEILLKRENNLLPLHMENELIKEFYVSAAECNARGELSMVMLVSRLIGIATDHANALGIGNPNMDGAGWVLSRLTIEANEYPTANSSYSIITWVEGWNRHFSERCFEIFNAKGESICLARSVWMVIDLVHHTNVGLGHLTLPEEMISSRKCDIARQKRARISQWDKENHYTFQYTDIDFYRHVNTLRYIQLLLNQFPLSTYDEHHIRRFEIAFLNEGHYGEEATILSHQDDDSTDLMICSEEKEIVKAKIRF
jgi:acyl-ACP thioesterase